MPSRPASSAASAIEKPRSCSPTRFPAGTWAPANRICAVAEPRMPILCSGRRGADPVGGRGHVEAADAPGPLPALGLARGPREHGVEVGLPAVRDPGLGAVDAEHLAVPLRARAHRPGVGAAARLGQAVGPEQVAAEQAGQPALLLLGVPAVASGKQLSTCTDARARSSARRRRVPPPPAGRSRTAGPRRRALRIRQPEQPRPAEQPEHLPGELSVPLGRGRRRAQFGVGDLGGQLEQVLRRLVADIRVRPCSSGRYADQLAGHPC